MSKRIEIDALSVAKRRQVLLEFDDLLKSDTRENTWHQFFETYPNILADSLSLQLNGIYSHVRLVAGTPDYVFHRSLGGNTGDYGVIELKRPDDSILGTYSVKHLIPSRKVVTAHVQAERYLASIQRGEFLNTDDFFVAGNRRHAFIIIGNSAELTEKCHSEIHRLQFQELLPPGFNLYTYDEVLQLFAATVPPTVKVVFASDITPEPKLVIAHVKVIAPYGLDAIPFAVIVRRCEQYAAETTFDNLDGVKVGSKSIVDLLMLAAWKGRTLRIESTGSDAEACVKSLAAAGYTPSIPSGTGYTRLFELVDFQSREVL